MAYIISAILLGAVLICVYKIIFPSRPLKSPPRFQNAELVKVLLGLEEKQLNDLFELYEDEFGRSAARYARRTYHKWKAGEVRPNRQTFNRFLVHLPEVMSFDLKCEVLRKLREAYCVKDNYQLTVYTDDWKEVLTPLIANIIDKAYTAEIPKQIERRLRWLSGDEMDIAHAILAGSQARESENTISLLQQEIFNIEQMLINSGGTRKVTHELKLPYGTITLKIKRR